MSKYNKLDAGKKVNSIQNYTPAPTLSTSCFLITLLCCQLLAWLTRTSFLLAPFIPTTNELFGSAKSAYWRHAEQNIISSSHSTHGNSFDQLGTKFLFLFNSYFCFGVTLSDLSVSESSGCSSFPSLDLKQKLIFCCFSLDMMTESVARNSVGDKQSPWQTTFNDLFENADCISGWTARL